MQCKVQVISLNLCSLYMLLRTQYLAELHSVFSVYQILASCCYNILV